MIGWIKKLFRDDSPPDNWLSSAPRYDPLAVDECCYPSRSIKLDDVKMPAPSEKVCFKTYDECIAYTFKSGEVCMFEWSDELQVYEKRN